MLRRFRPKSGLLAGLLIFALAVTAIVTYRAYVASKAHRAIGERMLAAYVAVAAYQMKMATETALIGCLQTWFKPVTTTPAESLRDVRLPVEECGNTSRLVFDIPPGGAAARVRGGTLSPDLVAWLRDTLETQPALPYRRNWDVGLVKHASAGTDELIAFARERQTRQIVGIRAEWPEQWIARQVLASLSLLPPDLTEGASNADLFDARVVSDAATRKWRQVVPLDQAFAGLAVDVGLTEKASALIMGGALPKRHGVQLLALLALAAGLVLSSLMLLHREADLARTRAAFVSSVSHELRTPLAQIRMFAEMLLLGRLRSDHDRHRSLEIINKEAQRLTQLVENVLQVARSEHNGINVNPRDAALAPVVRDTVECFAVLAEASRIEFRLELQEQLIVPADTAALRQILLNLLDNAAKYGPAGQRVTVGLALFGSMARLWVDDEGPGIPARERERVFQTFYRSAREERSHVAGTGIGLAVVRELAVLHGGRAYIEDAPCCGARVVVELPGARVDPARPVSDWAVA